MSEDKDDNILAFVLPLLYQLVFLVSYPARPLILFICM